MGVLCIFWRCDRCRCALCMVQARQVHVCWCTLELSEMQVCCVYVRHAGMHVFCLHVIG